jgi:hypothetical protein
MTQYTFPTINAAVDDGTDLAGFLNGLWSALRTMNSGTARPTYLTEGVFLKKPSGSLSQLVFWDGAVETVWMQGDPGTGTYTVQLGSNSVGSAQLQAGCVTTAKYATGSIPNAAVPNNEIDGGKLKDGTIVAAKYGAASIPTAAYQNLSITAGKLAAGVAGEVNTASNVGVGTGKFVRDKTGTNINVRSLRIVTSLTPPPPVAGGQMVISGLTVVPSVSGDDVVLTFGTTWAEITVAPPPGGGGGGGGGGTCFPPGTLVLRADGAWVPIETIRPGDFMVGAHGEINEVLAIDVPKLAGRALWRINGYHLTTAEHRHVTERGWASISPDDCWAEHMKWYPVMMAGGEIVDRQLVKFTRTPIETMVVGDRLLRHDGTHEAISTMWAEHGHASDMNVHTLVMGGSHTFVANGFVVSGWARDDDYDYETWTPIGGDIKGSP